LFDIIGSEEKFFLKESSMKLIACQECKRQWDVSRYRVGQKLRCVCNFVMMVQRQRSHTPEVHHCESCGAARPAASWDPCRYCGAIPTKDSAMMSLVCPLCMHRTAKTSQFCSSCGEAIQGGKLNVKTGKLNCPRCPKTKLMNRKVGDFMVDECPNCSGMWVEAGAFARILDQQSKRQDHQSLRGLGKGPVRAELERQTVVYLKCPACNRHMHRRHFGRASGVIIDECKEDGVWLDRDEMGKIAVFVASGGLQLARERLAEEHRQSGPETHIPIPALSQFPPLKSSSSSDDTPLTIALNVIRGLFG
jgi:Zn-finger nucleic acid-binding protein